MDSAKKYSNFFNVLPWTMGHFHLSVFEEMATVANKLIKEIWTQRASQKPTIPCGC